jgi:hypothetical protein
MSAPAGWYGDPAGTGLDRWWDGVTWTEHTQPGAPVAPPQVTAPPVALHATPEPIPAPIAVLPPIPQAPIPPVAPPVAAFAQPAPVPPTLVPGTSAFTITPHSAPATARRTSLGKPVLAVLLAAVLGAGGWIAYQQVSGSDPEPAAPSTHAAPATVSSKPLTAAAAGKALDRFKPGGTLMGAGIITPLVPKGNVVAGQRTLSGYCAQTYASDATRIARRQWRFTPSDVPTTNGPSVEVVAYATPARAAAAMAELTKRVQNCRAVKVTVKGGTLTMSEVSSTASSSTNGVRSFSSAVDVVGRSTAGQVARFHSYGIAQQRGQFVSIVWVNQRNALNAQDFAVLQPIAREQSAALLAAVPGGSV